MTFDPETMTGWDQDVTHPGQARTGALEIVLLALHEFLALDGEFGRDDDKVHDAYKHLVLSMSKIDWHALHFAQNAIDSGEELYTCFPNNDVLVKYTPPEKATPEQAELIF